MNIRKDSTNYVPLAQIIISTSNY